jgi:hypothetical protein
MRNQSQVQPMGAGMHMPDNTSNPPVYAPKGVNGMIPSPGMNVEPSCKFTVCFCIGCNYSAKSVYKAFHLCDCWWFGWWGVQGFFYLGTSVGMYGLVGAIFGLSFLGLAYLAIMNFLKFEDNIAQQTLNEKTNTYLTWRCRAIMGMAGLGLLLAILYFVLIYIVGKSAIEKAAGGQSQATDIAAAVLLFIAIYVMLVILISYGTLVACLLGCRPSARDSLDTLLHSIRGMHQHNQNGQGSVLMGDVSLYQPNDGPVYAAKPDSKMNPKQVLAGAPPANMNVGVAAKPSNQGMVQEMNYQSPAAPVQASLVSSPTKTTTKTTSGGAGLKRARAAPK